MISRFMALKWMKHLDTNMPQDTEKHEKALEELLRKIADKNRELYQLNQERDVLIKNIENLKLTVISLNDDIKAINKTIDDKRREAESDFQSVVRMQEGKYEEMLAEFRRKDEGLKDRELAIKSDIEKNIHLIDEIKERENDISSRSDKLRQQDKELNELRIEISNLNSALDNRTNEINLLALKKRAEQDARDKELDKKQSDIDALVNEANNKVRQANDVLAKMDEADKALLVVKEKERLISDRESKANELQVKAIADMRRVAMQEERLNEFERSLKRREENIKLAEGNITKG